MPSGDVYIFLIASIKGATLPSPTVKEIAFLPGGVQGLRLRRDREEVLLPLERGREISFRTSGRVVLAPSRDPCALCNGSRCMKGQPDCITPHLVYLAIFGRIAKVGVTKQRRYLMRMREQGAPFAAKLRVCPDGMEARRLERSLLSSPGVKGSVRFVDKVKSLGITRSTGEAEAVAAATGLPRELPVEDLRVLYQNPDLVVPSRPVVIRGDAVKGRIEDTRGEALYLTHRGNLYAYDLRRVVGRRIALGEARVEAQLTLQNFGESVET